MIAIRYQLTGGLTPYADRIRDAAADIVRAHTQDLQAAIVQSFEANKTGRLYARDDGTVYQASAPGEPPAVKEGDLFASVGWEADGLTGVVWTDDPKAPWLEYGTGAIESRPFFTPAAEEARRAFLADMVDLEARIRR